MMAMRLMGGLPACFLCVDGGGGGIQMSMLGSKFKYMKVAEGLASLDAVAMAIFVAAVVWLSYRETQAAKKMNSTTCTAADYTVKVTRLPEVTNLDHYQNQLKDHFEKVLSSEEAILTPGPIRVADVNIFVENGRLISLLEGRGILARQMDHINAKLSLETSHGHPHRVEKLQKEKATLEAK